MGNHVSQCVAGAGAAALVISPDGGRRRVDEAVGVAELMIDAPGHVVAWAADLRREQRVRAMPADEPLRVGEVYLLLPMGWAGTRLCDQQVAVIRRLVTGKRGKGGSLGRIFPEAAGEKQEVKGKVTGWAGQRARVNGPGPRQWRPVLDTIHES